MQGLVERLCVYHANKLFFSSCYCMSVLSDSSSFSLMTTLKPRTGCYGCFAPARSPFFWLSFLRPASSTLSPTAWMCSILSKTLVFLKRCLKRCSSAMFFSSWTSSARIFHSSSSKLTPRTTPSLLPIEPITSFPSISDESIPVYNFKKTQVSFLHLSFQGLG